METGLPPPLHHGWRSKTAPVSNYMEICLQVVRFRQATTRCTHIWSSSAPLAANILTASTRFPQLFQFLLLPQALSSSFLPSIMHLISDPLPALNSLRSIRRPLGLFHVDRALLSKCEVSKIMPCCAIKSHGEVAGPEEYLWGPSDREPKWCSRIFLLEQLPTQPLRNHIRDIANNLEREKIGQ